MLRRPGRLRLLLAVLLLAALPAPARAVAPAADPIPGVDPIRSFAVVGGRAFTPDGDGNSDRLELLLDLAGPASVAVDVLAWDGTPLAALLPTPASALPAGLTPLGWDGFGVPDGPYRVRATATTPGGTFTRQIDVARVSALPYPVNPGSVLVFLDPGHGGDAPGGVEARLPDGTLVREEVVNLDIALRLASMLRSAGLRVSLSRTTDVPANASRVDRNGDRKVDGADDYLARIDGANKARADLFISVHNNSIPGNRGRTEAFYCGAGCLYPAPSRALAADVLDAHVAALTPLQTADWEMTVGDPDIAAAIRNPTDDAVRFRSATFPPGRHFYLLGPYHVTFRPRSLQMPAALVESLALSHPTELAMLADSTVRSLLADAYFDGIVHWLAERPLGLRLDPAADAPPPRTARVGVATPVSVRVTNNGTADIAARTAIVVGTVPGKRPYDGSSSPGATIGRAYLREALAPGQSTVVTITVRPTNPGAALWKVDAVVHGVRTSQRRVPFLQLPVTVRR
jgi:N-acetylmuramoyl-L-alanine amidase